MKSQGWFVRNLIEILLKSFNMALKCPLKKSTKIRIQEQNTKNFSPVARMMDPEAVRHCSILVTAGQKAVPIITANLYLMRTDK